MADAPVAAAVLQCATCGEANGMGYMVFPLAEAPGPLYVCPRCHRWQAGERACRDCGRFMRRVAAVACPLQHEEPEAPHAAAQALLTECSICASRGVDLSWFDAAGFAEHWADHVLDGEAVPRG